MSVYVICYQDGTKKMRPVRTREEYMALRGSERQQRILAAVRGGDEAAKRRLVQMNYSCLPAEDGALRGATQPSDTVGMDVDHIKAEEMAAVRERILANKDALGLLMLERSARGQGFHLVFRRRRELTQEENLRRASDLLGVEFDIDATFQHSVSVKGATVSRNAVHQMLKNWRRQGLVVQTAAGRYRKVNT